MNAGKVLFPMMMLALLAGCSPDPEGRANAKAGPPSAPGLAAGPLLTGDIPARREQDPAARPASPELDPAPSRHGEMDSGPRKEIAAAGASTLRPLPMKPSVVNIPPPPYVPDLPPSDGTADPTPFPDEVTRFMVDRDSCDHFRGEEAYDAERLAYLQDNIAALCTGTDARLSLLRHRYADDPAVMSALRGYDDRIEGNASQ